MRVAGREARRAWHVEARQSEAQLGCPVSRDVLAHRCGAGVVNNRCHSYYLAHRRPSPASADFHPAHAPRRTPQPRHPVGLRLNIQFLIRCPRAKAGLRKLGTVGHRPRRDVATVARGLPDGGFYLEGVLDIPHHFDAFLIFSSRRGGEAAATSGMEAAWPAGAAPRSAATLRMPS